MKYTGIKSVDERINKKIKAAKTREYFVPRELDECNNLISKLQNIVNDYKSALEPWKKDAWWSAKYAIRNPAWEAVYGKTKSSAWCAARDAAWDAIKNSEPTKAAETFWNKAAQAVEDIARDVAWETVRDQKGFEKNPFEQLVRIYDIGLIPRDFRKIGNIENFVVDFPLKTIYLGCWTESDSKITFKHLWDENCNERKSTRAEEI